MVRAVALLLAVASLPAWGWEVTIAFTNDLHAALERLPEIAEVLEGADLVLDAGDTWEDLYRVTGLREALAMARRMGELGYDAMVLGNHEMYLGPALREVIGAAPFPVVVTNLTGDLPVRRWALFEAEGKRILVLGLLWEEYPWPLWPGLSLDEPVTAVREALAEAPPHDLLVLLGHMDIERAKVVAAQVPECDVFLLGHDHLWLTEPIWAAGVPIVEAGHRAGAVGLVRLGDAGFSYKLVRTKASTRLPYFWVPALALLGALLLAR